MFSSTALTNYIESALDGQEALGRDYRPGKHERLCMLIIIIYLPQILTASVILLKMFKKATILQKGFVI